MNVPARLGIFGLGLAVVFGAAMGTGRLTGPVGAEAKPSAAHGGMKESSGMEHGGAGHGGHGSMPPGGLLVSDRGYTLTTVPAATGTFAFRIVGPNGRAVTAFDTQHDKRMHLIVVRRDLSGFRHVHPTMDADGTWQVASPLSGPGTYRAFADFKPTGADPLTLGIDETVAGDAAPRPLPAPATTATVDGYTVTLAGTLVAGRSSRLDMTISRDGRPVTDLQPYLAAYGHLVALRQGDLAYLHVHPDGEPGDGKTRPGPVITFFAEAPSVGTYRLYLDFQHEGTVHTAEFTVTAGASDTTSGDHQH
ncbi:hypothetical protein AB0L00_17650 [Actinoallomurus sp. NPDC052308]|uniref:hypothetical protein n=1 Tax=Actinoallomurus sp. NPDC052308 TaxID=3155530 RepID=UPI00343D622C